MCLVEFLRTGTASVRRQHEPYDHKQSTYVPTTSADVLTLGQDGSATSADVPTICILKCPVGGNFLWFTK